MHVLLSTSIPFYVAVYLLLARSSSMAEGIAAVIGNVADNCGPAAPSLSCKGAEYHTKP